MIFAIFITQLQVTIARNGIALTGCMNVSHIVGYEWERVFVSVYHDSSVSTDNILMWICQSQSYFTTDDQSVSKPWFQGP
jgi:hypothetical protein